MKYENDALGPAVTKKWFSRLSQLMIHMLLFPKPGCDMRAESNNLERSERLTKSDWSTNYTRTERNFGTESVRSQMPDLSNNAADDYKNGMLGRYKLPVENKVP